MRNLLTAACAAALLCAPLLAQAQPPCMDHTTILRLLAERHNERVVGRGITADGLLLEITIAPDGAFTVLVTVPEGATCVVAVGEGWTPARPSPALGREG